MNTTIVYILLSFSSGSLYADNYSAIPIATFHKREHCEVAIARIGNTRYAFKCVEMEVKK